MKRSRTIVAGLVLGLATSAVQGQVIVEIMEPLSIMGTYANTVADPANGWDNIPDMSLEANAVTGEVVLAYDNTAADSLACEELANAAEVNGKIALVYRGSCDHSAKAMNCQNAGAIAMIEINNVAGPPAAMGGSTLGPDVTIPVFMIRQDDGALIRAVLDNAELVTAFLGNKNFGHFADDIGMYKNDPVRPVASATPALLAQNDTEYSLILGAWVHNYGQNIQENVTLNATVSNGGVLYNETTAPTPLLPGDSTFIQLPDFVQPNYGGVYTLTYTASTGGTDNYTRDNTYITEFVIDSMYALGPLNMNTGRPIVSIGLQPAPVGSEFISCIHFRDPNASRVAVAGMDFYTSKNGGSLDGEVIQLRIFEWSDDFTGLSDPNFALDNIAEISNTEFIIEVDTTSWSGYVPLQQAYVLEDDVRYLFCVSTNTSSMFFGYNDTVSYVTNEQEDVYDQPTSPENNGTQWFVGFVGDPVSSLAVNMVPSETIGIHEQSTNDLQAYPNPASKEVLIPLAGIGAGDLSIFDAQGKLMSTQRVQASIGTMRVDVSELPAGAYTFDVVGADKQHHRSRVAVVR
jgi:hypothetical protein